MFRTVVALHSTTFFSAAFWSGWIFDQSTYHDDTSLGIVCFCESELATSSCVYTIEGNVDFNIVGYLNVVGNDEAGFNEVDCSFC